MRRLTNNESRLGRLRTNNTFRQIPCITNFILLTLNPFTNAAPCVCSIADQAIRQWNSMGLAANKSNPKLLSFTPFTITKTSKQLNHKHHRHYHHCIARHIQRLSRTTAATTTTHNRSLKSAKRRSEIQWAIIHAPYKGRTWCERSVCI